MTGSDLELFRIKMGWSVRETCRQLDVSQDRYRRMRDGMVEIPRYIELACERLSGR